MSLRLGYGLALFIPIIGFILGIIAATRNAVGHGVGMMAVALFASTLWFLAIDDLVTPDQECSTLVEGLCRDVPESIGPVEAFYLLVLVIVPLGLLVSYAIRKPERRQSRA
jgi:hypothetical protein